MRGDRAPGLPLSRHRHDAALPLAAAARLPAAPSSQPRTRSRSWAMHYPGASAAAVYERLLPHVMALPAATAIAPNPDPVRMYAAVAGRITDTAQLVALPFHLGLRRTVIHCTDPRTPIDRERDSVSGGEPLPSVQRETPGQIRQDAVALAARGCPPHPAIGRFAGRTADRR